MYMYVQAVAVTPAFYFHTVFATINKFLPFHLFTQCIEIFQNEVTKEFPAFVNATGMRHGQNHVDGQRGFP